MAFLRDDLAFLVPLPLRGDEPWCIRFFGGRYVPAAEDYAPPPLPDDPTDHTDRPPRGSFRDWLKQHRAAKDG